MSEKRVNVTISMSKKVHDRLHKEAGEENTVEELILSMLAPKKKERPHTTTERRNRPTTRSDLFEQIRIHLQNTEQVILEAPRDCEPVIREKGPGWCWARELLYGKIERKNKFKSGGFALVEKKDGSKKYEFCCPEFCKILRRYFRAEEDAKLPSRQLED